MKANEIVESIKQSNPQLFGKMPDQKAITLVQAVLAELGKQIDAVDNGVVKVQGFGNFRIKQVEREKDGEKVTLKKVAFRKAKRKAKLKVKVAKAG